MQWLINFNFSDFHYFSSFHDNFLEGLRNSNFYQFPTLSMWKDCFWNSFLVRPNFRNLNHKFVKIAKNYNLLRKDFHFICTIVPSLHFSLLCSRKTIEWCSCDANLWEHREIFLCNCTRNVLSRSKYFYFEIFLALSFDAYII